MTESGFGRSLPAPGRERALDAAYELFSRHGIRAVGVEAVVARAGVAKMTLYRHFLSKEELVLAFLERRETRWTDEWIRAGTTRLSATPAGRLLAVFDLFDGWFREPGFEGCPFIRVLLELGDEDGPVRQASIRHLANVRHYLAYLAEAAGLTEPDAVARQWHLLMKGSIISALEGDHEAALRAKEIGALVLLSQGGRTRHPPAHPADGP
ncbi:TetR/AcrR family transcriptional regulator [Amycolatopsis sp. H20-H5]|uniref:TetR/AcrR family transcriptional regulator n=1 Tax=Amycolatopsis sp. H20-H5 TaxID=3046309 RepID=UPI002DB7B23B|nr:helix-turn-helix domain-containing protein [Amycolatopsis sp. H20-H5]MEC3976091.1 helix-turn-helix domain-containing protein [Amycolatopsis sp. H20-H5]